MATLGPINLGACQTSSMKLSVEQKPVTRPTFQSCWSPRHRQGRRFSFYSISGLHPVSIYTLEEEKNNHYGYISHFPSMENVGIN